VARPKAAESTIPVRCTRAELCGLVCLIGAAEHAQNPFIELITARTFRDLDRLRPRLLVALQLVAAQKGYDAMAPTICDGWTCPRCKAVTPDPCSAECEASKREALEQLNREQHELHLTRTLYSVQSVLRTSLRLHREKCPHAKEHIARLSSWIQELHRAMDHNDYAQLERMQDEVIARGLGVE